MPLQSDCHNVSIMMTLAKSNQLHLGINAQSFNDCDESKCQGACGQAVPEPSAKTCTLQTQQLMSCFDQNNHAQYIRNSSKHNQRNRLCENFLAQYASFNTSAGERVGCVSPFRLPIGSRRSWPRTNTNACTSTVPSGRSQPCSNRRLSVCVQRERCPSGDGDRSAFK
jgi:hypothetical protein